MSKTSPGPSLSQARLKSLKKLALKKYRDREGRFIIEGVRLCEEALAAGAEIETWIYAPSLLTRARGRALLDRIPPRHPALLRATSAQFKALTQVASPQGIACVVRKREQKALPSGISGLYLVLDRISDPGNMGTILRTAAWFGVDGVLAGPGTVENTHPAVMRASAGALFHLPAFENVRLEQWLVQQKERGFILIAADARDGTDVRELRSTGRDILVIGSEAGGIDPALENLMTIKTHIPGFGAGESLNAAVACAIVLYQLTHARQ